MPPPVAHQRPEDYIVLGLLNMVAFYTANYYLSVSATFSRAAGMLVGPLAPEHLATNAYWKMVKPILDRQFMLVFGIPLGAHLAVRLSQRAVAFSTKLPETWVNRRSDPSSLAWPPASSPSS